MTLIFTLFAPWIGWDTEAKASDVSFNFQCPQLLATFFFFSRKQKYIKFNQINSVHVHFWGPRLVPPICHAQICQPPQWQSLPDSAAAEDPRTSPSASVDLSIRITSFFLQDSRDASHFLDSLAPQRAIQSFLSLKHSPWPAATFSAHQPPPCPDAAGLH